MKKLYAVLAVILCLILSPLAVRADVIDIPDDPFFYDHEEECRTVDITFETNGPNGSVTLYRSPEDPTVVMSVENGTLVHIKTIYEDKDGTAWGIELYGNGWMPIDHLWRVYDGGLFRNDHISEFESLPERKEYEGSADEVVLYEYPCSADDYYTIDWLTPEDLSYDTVFTDPAGHVWAYCDSLSGYMGASSPSWICLDDVTALPGKLYPDGVPEMDTRIKPVNTNEIVPVRNMKPYYLTAALVLGAAILSLVLILILKRKPEKAA